MLAIPDAMVSRARYVLNKKSGFLIRIENPCLAQTRGTYARRDCVRCWQPDWQSDAGTAK